MQWRTRSELRDASLVDECGTQIPYSGIVGDSGKPLHPQGAPSVGHAGLARQMWSNDLVPWYQKALSLLT